jgi:hypothetical protein
VAAIPLEVERAIMRSLAKRIEARFQTAAEFREVVVKALGGNGDRIANRVIVGAAHSIPPATPSLSTAVSKEVLKETRLGDELLNPPTPDWRSIGELKETRLGVREDLQIAAAGTGEDKGGLQTMARRGSLLSKLNWMHYAGAAVVAVLVGTSIAMFGFGGKEKPAAATERPTEAPRAPAPPKADEPLPQNPQPETAIQSDEIVRPSREKTRQRSASGSQPRQRGTRSDRQAYSPPPRTTPQPSVERRANPPAVSQQAPAPAPAAAPAPAPAPAAARRNEPGIKESAKTLGEGAKKAFGSLFGHGGDKNKDKDKKKKP